MYQAGRMVHRQCQRLGLRIVVAQHQLSDFLGHVAKQVVAIFDADLSCINCGIEKNLDIDFVIRGIDPGGIVDSVGMTESTMAAVFDPGELG